MRRFLLFAIILFITTPSVSQDKHNWDLPMDPPPKITNPKEIKKLPPPPENPFPVEEIPNFGGEPINSENKTIVFVIDTSGSMVVYMGSFVDDEGNVVNNGSRLDRAKVELRKSIRALPEKFRLNVISYSCTVRHWARELRYATPENKASAINFVNSMTPTGGTGTGFGVASALEYKDVKSVALLTDGFPGCGGEIGDPFAAHRLMIKTANTQNASVNVFAIGAAAIERGLTFCQDVARENSGFVKELH